MTTPTPTLASAPRSTSAALGGALALIIGLTLARVVYLVALCPYELAADEAQYWDWSRPGHLGLSYYSKGPGIAWLIAASTRLFGEAEWAIRLPAALSTGVAMLALAAIAGRIGGRRAALFAVLLFCCIPAYHATAILMTIDAPYLACWSIALLAAWVISERPTVARWAALGAAVGVGFLFKYTILLLIPGLVVFWWMRRPRGRVSYGGFALAAIIFGALASPVFIWNARHGWPTLAHLLGHIGAAGGDTTPDAGRSYDPWWTLEFLGTQAGLIGPILVLCVISVRRGLRSAEPEVIRAARFALAAALPILCFYFAVSFTSDVEGNWPIAGYLSLIIPAALMLSGAPVTGVARGAWHWAIGFGVVSAIAVGSLQWLDRVPVLTGAIPYHRLSGHRLYAERIAAAFPGEREYIADQYTRAALMAYYLPGRPAVRSATSFLGGRRSSYDFFADTSLHDPRLLKADLVLIGASPEKWGRAFRFESIEEVVPAEPKRPAVYLGRGFGGPIEQP